MLVLMKQARTPYVLTFLRYLAWNKTRIWENPNLELAFLKNYTSDF